MVNVRLVYLRRWMGMTSSTLPSPILTVFERPRILTIVGECSEATEVSAND